MRADCPLCGNEGKVIKCRMGQGWRDLVGKPPHSLFNDYKMVHAADGQGGRHLFLHTERDMK